MKKIYLSLVESEQAKKLIYENFSAYKLEPEVVLVKDSCGRVTAAEVYANICSPNYIAAAMDGVATVASKLIEASQTSPKILTIPQDAVYISTGQPLPIGFDTVIKIEEVSIIDEHHIKVKQAPAPWTNVRRIGEDIVAGEILLPINHKITPADICALYCAGVLEVKVYKKPKVEIIPVGSEVCIPKTTIKDGEVIDSNSYMLKALVDSWGAEAEISDILPDDVTVIAQRLSEYSKDCDILVLIGGSSVGAYDYTYTAIAKIAKVLFHGVKLSPGKPLLLANLFGKPIFGMPGYPVSCLINAEEFLKYTIALLLKQQSPKRKTIKVHILQKITSKLGTESLVRVNIGYIDNKYVAICQKQGAGVITSITKADGIIRLPSTVEGILAGSTLDAEIFYDEETIKNNILLAGSHDTVLDILGNFLKQRYPYITLGIVDLGSKGGLSALSRGEVHGSAVSLLDSKSGEYNVPYIKEIFKGKEVILIPFLRRSIGLLVKQDNPKNINSLEDLYKVKFVNYQSSVDMRIIVDYLLEKYNIDKDKIAGYDYCVAHVGEVGQLVSRGVVDCGFGTMAVAKLFGLEFIYLTEDEYDLVFLKQTYEDNIVQKLLEILISDDFINKISTLGGYFVKENIAKPITFTL